MTKGLGSLRPFTVTLRSGPLVTRPFFNSIAGPSEAALPLLLQRGTKMDRLLLEDGAAARLDEATGNRWLKTFIAELYGEKDK